MNKKEVIDIIREERLLYSDGIGHFGHRYHHKRYDIWKYLKTYRLSKYYEIKRKNADNCFNKLFYFLLARYYYIKRNKQSSIAGVEISSGVSIGRRIDIWHSGVVINGNVGDDCIFHGNNIIGNKGLGHSNEIPTIGNKVDIGAGANIIGAVSIANECKIGAGATVVKNCLDEGAVLVGVPAKKRM